MLRKDFQREFFPGTPGQAEVVAQPELTVCQPQGGGSWQVVCSRVEIPRNGGIVIPPGGRVVTVYDPNGELDPLTGQVKVIDVYLEVCVSQWVPEPNSGEPVCVTYPAIPYQPAVPAVPARYETRPVIGWDAGANSVVTHAGDCEVVWTMGLVAGVYLGLTDDREAIASRARIAHGLFFFQRAGAPFFRIVEGGAARSGDIAYAPGDAFAVRRARGVVSYRHNGDALRTVEAAFTGTASVGCALYASGDSIE